MMLFLCEYVASSFFFLALFTTNTRSRYLQLPLHHHHNEQSHEANTHWTEIAVSQDTINLSLFFQMENEQRKPK